MGTKNNPGLFDCYKEAGSDEPIFILRANDELAPNIIRFWAEEYRISKLKKSKDNKLTPKQESRYQEARLCARSMEVWKINSRSNIYNNVKAILKTKSIERNS